MNNPRKSRAIIITVIAIIILAIVAYFVFKKSDQLVDTKDSTSTSRTFTSLFGSSKSKKEGVITSGTEDVSSTGTPGVTNTSGGTEGGLSTSGGLGSTGGLGSSKFGTSGSFGSSTTGGAQGGLGAITPPPWKPLPTPGGSTGIIPPASDPAPTKDPAPLPPVVVNESLCPLDDPLVFTDAEKTELENLLKQYYLIAPKLKTEDDLALLINDISTNQALVDQATTLTNQCQTQKLSLIYTGPQSVKDNPYYSQGADQPYIPAYSLLEQILNIW